MLSLVAGSMVHADLCHDIRAIGTEFAKTTLTLPETGKTAECTRSRVLAGGSQMHCGWAFSYRSPAAAQAFEHLLVTVADCLGAAARVTADKTVNHPDFYDLQTFQFEGQEIGVSLKDKAALSETYVFLRVKLP